MGDMILSINPGGGSTKIGLFRLAAAGQVEEDWTENIRHGYQELDRFPSTVAQEEFRRDAVLAACGAHDLPRDRLASVAGRGGPLAPMPGGVYEVSEIMLRHIRAGRVQADHPSLLGALLAHQLAVPLGIPAYIVDPVSTDELLPEARLSGMPGIDRVSLTHALNIKSMCRAAARRLGKAYEELSLVGVHLGSGASVTSHHHGRMIDLNDSASEGPFGTQRSGGLPTRALLKWAMAGGIPERELHATLMRKGGLAAYTGSDDFPELLRRRRDGDAAADLVYSALLLQVKKEIGAYAAVLDGRVDAVVIGGGLAYEKDFTTDLEEVVKWIAPVMIFPGEDELKALAEGAARTVTGLEQPRRYEEEVVDEI
ncbi:butyrate kinase [bacterium]|nr:butyrate kinase [candidate division CSSED10-310 bacterium]